MPSRDKFMMNPIFSSLKNKIIFLGLSGSLLMPEGVFAQSFTFDTDDRVQTISNLAIGSSSFDVTFNPNSSFNSKKFKVWLKDYLAPYKIPKEFVVIDPLPRNSLGKVQKKQLVASLSSK